MAEHATISLLSLDLLGDDLNSTDTEGREREITFPPVIGRPALGSPETSPINFPSSLSLPATMNLSRT